MVLKEIREHVFDIPDRLKSIDKEYHIYYNPSTLSYELHNLRYNPSFQLILPFTQLDCRTVEYVRRTRLDRILNDINTIEEYNEKLQTSKIDSIMNEASYKIRSLNNYINKGGSEIPLYDEM